MKAGDFYKVKDGFKHSFKKDTYFLLLCNVHHSEDWYIANYNMAQFDSFMAAKVGSFNGLHPKFPILTKQDIKNLGIYVGNIKELTSE